MLLQDVCGGEISTRRVSGTYLREPISDFSEGVPSPCVLCALSSNTSLSSGVALHYPDMLVVDEHHLPYVVPVCVFQQVEAFIITW